MPVFETLATRGNVLPRYKRATQIIARHPAYQTYRITWDAQLRRTRRLKAIREYRDTLGCRVPHDVNEIRWRYPKLIRAMVWTAVLSSGEAACAIRDFRHYPFPWSTGGEAVSHFGGPAAVIHAAIKNRHNIPANARGKRKVQTCFAT